jgi:hypothetical protein
MIESVAILDIAPVSYSGQNGAASSKIWDDIHSIVTGLDSMPVETLKDKKEADKWLAQVRLMPQMISTRDFKYLFAHITMCFVSCTNKAC